jgi:hypothetical protein
MKMRYDTYIYFQVIFLACGVCAGRSLAAVTCPPAAALTDTAKNIDLGKYIAAPWYTQQQVQLYSSCLHVAFPLVGRLADSMNCLMRWGRTYNNQVPTQVLIWLKL